MKKLLVFLIMVLFLLVAFYYREEISYFYNTKLVKNEKLATPLVKNPYYRDYDFNYVRNTTDFSPKNKQDIINIYYTVINSGMSSFTFYCSEEYVSCIPDVKDIANDQITLSNLNNFLHPFNSFKKIETEYDTLGQVTIKVMKNYSETEIDVINRKVDEIINEVIKADDSDQEKIKKIHDYIISISRYDKNRSDHNIVTYKSDVAYGPLLQGYAVCGGYTDSMMIFLERFGIKSIKISSSNHIWNYVYLNGKWLHLDLTWDDPITSNNTDIVDYSYFLITDEELAKLDLTQHIYDKSIYQ